MATKIDTLKNDPKNIEVAKEASTVAKVASSVMVIENDQQYDAAAQAALEVKRVFNAAEERRKFIVKPLNDHVKDINEWFKTITVPLAAKEAELKKAIGAYAVKKEQDRVAAQRALEEETARLQAEIDLEAEAMGVETIELAVPELIKQSPSATGIGVKMLWTYEVTDFAKLPDEFKIENSAAINSAIKGEAGSHDIPGLRIYQVPNTSIRVR